MDEPRNYSVRELQRILVREYGKIPERDWEAYEMLKDEMGLKDQWFPEDEFRERHDKILEVLGL